MYYLYVRGASFTKPGNDHWRLLGIFPGSNYWTESYRLAETYYGERNVTYRWHS
jgi:hypothetical protein